MAKAPVPPYGVAIHKAIASRQREQMEEARERALRYLQEHGNVSASLEMLKIEIAKLQFGGE